MVSFRRSGHIYVIHGVRFGGVVNCFNSRWLQKICILYKIICGFEFNKSSCHVRVKSDSEVVVESTVRSFHVHDTSWNPVPGKQLEAEREPGNPNDSFAIR